jgi:hypothetical protein
MRFDLMFGRANASFGNLRSYTIKHQQRLPPFIDRRLRQLFSEPSRPRQAACIDSITAYSALRKPMVFCDFVSAGLHRLGISDKSARQSGRLVVEGALFKELQEPLYGQPGWPTIVFWMCDSNDRVSSEPYWDAFDKIVDSTVSVEPVVAKTAETYGHWLGEHWTPKSSILEHKVLEMFEWQRKHGPNLSEDGNVRDKWITLRSRLDSFERIEAGTFESSRLQPFLREIEKDILAQYFPTDRWDGFCRTVDRAQE